MKSSEEGQAAIRRPHDCKGPPTPREIAAELRLGVDELRATQKQHGPDCKGHPFCMGHLLALRIAQFLDPKPADGPVALKAPLVSQALGAGEAALRDTSPNLANMLAWLESDLAKLHQAWQQLPDAWDSNAPPAEVNAFTAAARDLVGGWVAQQ